VVELERLDEVSRVSDLAPAAAPHEPPELLLQRPPLPGRLFLERAERAEISMSLDDLLDDGAAESTDQLLLEILVADIEPQRLHVGACEVGAESGPLEASTKLGFLGGVAETGDPHAQPLGAVALQEAPDGLGTADRHDRDALGPEIAAPALGEGLDGDLVAGALDQHDCARDGAQR
jgi:hypothetical protein